MALGSQRNLCHSWLHKNWLTLQIVFNKSAQVASPALDAFSTTVCIAVKDKPADQLMERVLEDVEEWLCRRKLKDSEAGELLRVQSTAVQSAVLTNPVGWTNVMDRNAVLLWRIDKAAEDVRSRRAAIVNRKRLPVTSPEMHFQQQCAWQYRYLASLVVHCLMTRRDGVQEAEDCLSNAG